MPRGCWCNNCMAEPINGSQFCKPCLPYFTNDGKVCPDEGKRRRHLDASAIFAMLRPPIVSEGRGECTCPGCTLRGGRLVEGYRGKLVCLPCYYGQVDNLGRCPLAYLNNEHGSRRFTQVPDLDDWESGPGPAPEPELGPPPPYESPEAACQGHGGDRETWLGDLLLEPPYDENDIG